MITLRQLAPLLLAIALGSAPLHAQPAPQPKTNQPAGESAGKKAPAPQAPASTEAAKQSTPAATRKESPQDYRPSEEISEDVPVSFPVDI